MAVILQQQDTSLDLSPYSKALLWTSPLQQGTSLDPSPYSKALLWTSLLQQGTALDQPAYSKALLWTSLLQQGTSLDQFPTARHFFGPSPYSKALLWTCPWHTYLMQVSVKDRLYKDVPIFIFHENYKKFIIIKWHCYYVQFLSILQFTIHKMGGFTHYWKSP